MAERRALAAERKRETLLAAVIHDAGLLLACLLPLVIAVLMLMPRRDEQPPPELCDVLIAELASGRRLLASPERRALPDESTGEATPDETRP